jgi:hypothetical protein
MKGGKAIGILEMTALVKALVPRVASEFGLTAKKTR